MVPDLAVAATFAADPLRLPLRCLSKYLRSNSSVELAPYNQVFQQLLDPDSMLAQFAGMQTERAGVLLIRWEDWLENQWDTDELTQRTSEFSDALGQFSSSCSLPLLTIFCPPTEDQSAASQFTHAEKRIADRFDSNAALQFLSGAEIVRRWAVGTYHDPVALKTAHIPYNAKFFAGLAAAVTRGSCALVRRPYKVVALDADNTLWSGVCSELGPQGIRVSPGHRLLQDKMRELRAAGLLLCLCSKNEATDVWNVFAANPDMPLGKSDFTATEINWHPKSDNLRRIAQELNLGLDGFIFIDDNPIECAEVMSRCPEVLTLQLPPEHELAEFLDHSWALDQIKLTQEDRNRSAQYSEEKQRRRVRSSVTSLKSFLQQLELRVEFEAFAASAASRISQLTERTNQFNLSGLKLTQSDVIQIAEGRNAQYGFSLTVTDKFGDYGRVGAAVCHQGRSTAGEASQHQEFNEKDLVVDALLLSCRALGRGVELHMLRRIGELAASSGCQRILLPLRRTGRNQPIVQFLESVCSPLDSASEIYYISTEKACELDPLSMAENQSATPSVEPATAADNTTINLPPAPSIELTRLANELRTAESIQQLVLEQASARPEMEDPYVAPSSKLERQVVAACEEILNVKPIGIADGIKQLGGNSIDIVQLHSRFRTDLKSTLSITELYTLPTVGAIVERLEQELLQSNPKVVTRSVQQSLASDRQPASDEIAVVGLAGRFPGADNPHDLWSNLRQGVCSIVPLSDQQLNLAENDPLRRNPNLVRMSAAVRDADCFDAKFFNIFPREARLMDPQHRLFLQTCWHALEDAGYVPDTVNVPVGVFAGCYMDTYILASLAHDPSLLEGLANSFHGGDLLTELGNDKDYLATRVAFLLNLSGPALTIQTACSTSLVAIIQACESLRSGHCDMALAGGATLKLPQQRGYLYTEGGMVSPDGVVRTFDADARGTVFGEGVGAVLLKRNSDAIADGDDIYAVIKGCGLNNDGRDKMGYTAPSIQGQQRAITMAHRQAGISADSISYVEAHGTGTALGDPIEIDALTSAFGESSDVNQHCAIGSLKTNIGHLDVAAGVSGLIKICLALKHGQIPPSLNFNTPNPNIDFANSPFFVNTSLRPWPRGGQPRRAGLSSFGVGGTNAHIVIEEAAPVESTPSRFQSHILTLSARTPEALQTLERELANVLREKPDSELADVAYTLNSGRKRFAYSRTVVSDSCQHAAEQFVLSDGNRSTTLHQVRKNRPVVLLFPGQGSQHASMANQLYRSELRFSVTIDRCCDILEQFSTFDFRTQLFSPSQVALSPEEINQTSVAQPAIFAVSYALAKWYMELGIVPTLLVGHSVGEFVAATLSGVFQLEEALEIITLRGQVMQALPSGNMLAVRLPEGQLRPKLQDEVAIAAINSPNLCVASGPAAAIESLAAELEDQDIICRPLHTSHAFHSSMMDPAIAPLRDRLTTCNLSAPQIPIVSSVTGKELIDSQAVDPNYWARHLRETVRFTDALTTALDVEHAILTESGPGQTLTTLSRQHPARTKNHAVIASLPHAKQESTASSEHLLLAAGQLWQHGAPIDLARRYAGEHRRRVHLPTYPFERQRHWFDQFDNETRSLETTPSEPTSSTESNEIPHSGPTRPLVPAACVVQTTAQTNAPDNRVQPAEDISSESPAQRVVKQQLQLMQLQLKTWRR